MIHQGKPCVEKIKYRTAVDANRELLKIKDKFGPKVREKRFYLCPECKNYHLTSKIIYQKPRLYVK